MSSVPDCIRILTVDDHPLFRQGIAALLSSQPDMSLVAEASNGRDAIRQFRAHRPDITLMDLQMPDMNGLDAMIAIRGGIPGGAHHHSHHLRGRCSGVARYAGGRPGVPSQEPFG